MQILKISLEITLKEVLELVTFAQTPAGHWHVKDVKGDIWGDVEGDVKGDVWSTIAGRQWQFVETPKEKLQRLIEETGNQELIEAFNQLEDN